MASSSTIAATGETRTGERQVDDMVVPSLEQFREVYKEWFNTVGKQRSEVTMDEDEVECWWVQAMEDDRERLALYSELKVWTENYVRKRSELLKAVKKKAVNVKLINKGKNLDEEVGVPWTHCSPSAINELVKGMTDLKKIAIVQMGFGGLLNIKTEIMHKKELTKMLGHLNTDSWEIVYPGATTVQLSSKLLGEILNLRIDGLKVPQNLGEIKDGALGSSYNDSIYHKMKYTDVRSYHLSSAPCTNSAWKHRLVLYAVGKY